MNGLPSFSVQTISTPYQCAEEDRKAILAARRLYSACVRTAYANAVRADGSKVPEKDLRHLVKARHAGNGIDAWLKHCATLEGIALRKARPDGKMVFGGRRNLARRNKGLIVAEAWKAKRLMPLCSIGDKLFKGNRHFRLGDDARSCRFAIYGRAVTLALPAMAGNAGIMLREVARLAASGELNVQFKLDDGLLHVTFDPERVPLHPQRKTPVPAVRSRAVGVDLNPAWIGIACVENAVEPRSLSETRVLDHALVGLDLPWEASPEQVREALAAAADKVIAMARAHGAGLIVLESGLGRLRSGGKSRTLNFQINHWARTMFGHMASRRARLCGIKVAEVWGGYSTTIGNLAFPLPDACASAVEIGRRGIARDAGEKDVLPDCTDAVTAGLWKDRGLPTGAMPRPSAAWRDVHRAIKAAKLGVRRPHPALPSGPGVRKGVSSLTPCGHAVTRLGLRRRPGVIFRPSRDGPMTASGSR